jgi:penicillin-binding protein 1A
LFIGFAGDLVVGVWVGNDDNSPLPGTSGGGLPARIWRGFMSEALGIRAAAPRTASVPLSQTDRDDSAPVEANATTAPALPPEGPELPPPAPETAAPLPAPPKEEGPPR